MDEGQDHPALSGTPPFRLAPVGGECGVRCCFFWVISSGY